MNAGYVRLSRDDDKQNYVSIENQKLIINQFAAEQELVIDRWYEDDGISGYKFDRPGFNQLIKDLDKDINIVFVKDFSRLGRHNAKVLLLLDEFQERGKRLIVIDDNYDSSSPEDDTIGIKTWYNERYVKDTSKKIRRALEARQKEGTLITYPPFGYKRNEKDKTVIEISPKEAEYVKIIYELYLQGFGYRKLANHLTEEGIPTPSMIRHEREIKEGHICKRQIATEWSDSMVKDILANDFYIGTLRLRKRTRSTVHGRDKRVPNDEQYIFENNHPAIIDKSSFNLIQDMKEKRVKGNYRGSHKQWLSSGIPSPFGSCLYCKDCGSRLTPIKRETSARTQKYYICTTYNTKGKRYCSKAHLIKEEDLMDDMIHYIKLCRDSLSEVISSYNIQDFESQKKSAGQKRIDLQNTIEEQKKLLKGLFTQKQRDLMKAPEFSAVLNETYDSLQKDLLARIHRFEMQLSTLNVSNLENGNIKEKFPNALQVMDKIISSNVLTRKDVEILIERIEVDGDGFPEIKLKYPLSGLIKYHPALEMNRRENEIIYHTMRLILEDRRDYTSAKFLSKALTETGFPKSKKSILPYIALLIDMKILEPTDNSLKPYTIIKSEDEIRKLMTNYEPNLH